MPRDIMRLNAKLFQKYADNKLDWMILNSVQYLWGRWYFAAKVVHMDNNLEDQSLSE